MHKWMMAAILMLSLGACRAMLTEAPLQMLDLDRGRTLAGAEAVAALQQARIVLVGEQHTNPWHHQAQLAVIQALHQSGKRVAVGLEMFRHEGQADLDRWVAGRVDVTDFQDIYLDHWNYDWALYAPIFHYARDHALPMVGLNVPREISRQVARHGFASLTPAQRGELDEIVCDVTPAYRAFILKAYEAHAHGRMDFEHFCQAQLLWDEAMAQHAIRYLAAHPDRTLVILTGSAHARKMGIPTRVARHGPWPMAVILPETPGVFETDTVTAADADYLLRVP